MLFRSTSLTIAKPTGVASGDLLIAAISQTGQASTNASLAGWTVIDGRSLAGSTLRYLTVLYKVAGGSEPSNYGFTIAAGTTVVGGIVAFSNVNGSSPFDVTPGTISVQASQTAVAATSVTTVTNGAMIVMVGSAAGSAPTFSGWTTTSRSEEHTSELQSH